MSYSRAKKLSRLERIVGAVYLFYYRCRFGHDIRLIPLTKYKFAIVDADVYDRLKNYNWRPKRSLHTWYAVRGTLVCEKRSKKLVWLHNEVMQNSTALLVDHFNRNGLDNRRANLRLATRGQNCCNTKKQKGCSSKFKGVCFHKNRTYPNPWEAYISVNCRRIHLGRFPTEIAAARAYDEAAKKYHGEFATLNFTEYS